MNIETSRPNPQQTDSQTQNIADMNIEISGPNFQQTDSQTQNNIDTMDGSIHQDSPFFTYNPPASLPTFSKKEIVLGDVLGVGQFGIVQDLKWIQQDKSVLLPSLLRFQSSVLSSSNPIEYNKYKTSAPDSDSNKFNGNLENVKEARAALLTSCCEDGKTQFAVKSLRNDLEGERRFKGLLDLESEAKLLVSLNHPNIVRLRAFVWVPDRTELMLVLDKLHLTLVQQISKWKAKNRMFCYLPRMFKHPNKRDNFFTEQINTAYDISSALRHLHKHAIIHRDRKPENIAFDDHGNARVYDLGLAREVRQEDLVRAPEDYNLSGLTGALRWMAPEVRLCKPYGFSADVYSFGLIFWNIFSLQTPFGKISTEKHFKKVIQSGERPHQLILLPLALRIMMTRCWDSDRSKRPSFGRICSIIQEEICKIDSFDMNVPQRGTHLRRGSNHSNTDSVDTKDTSSHSNTDSVDIKDTSSHSNTDTVDTKNTVGTKDA